MQVQEAYKAEVTKLMEQVDSKEDPLKQTVRTCQHNTNTLLQTARSLKTELQRGTRQIDNIIAENTEEQWQGKKIHGQLPNNLDEKLMDNEQSYNWLKFRDMKGETE